MKKHIWQMLVVVAALIGACSILVHPHGDVKGRASDAPLMIDTVMDSNIAKIVEKSCKNCHSERTEWPWYSYVAPMSWLVEGDVYDGRRHMNLSHWDVYSIEEKQVVLSEIAVMVRNHKMPPSRYLVLHSEAKLSESEIAEIYQWARNERRRLKTLATTKPGASPGAGQ